MASTKRNAHIFRTLSLIINSNIFRHFNVQFKHIQPHCGIFRKPCVTLAYSELCHIQILAYLEPRKIQNSVEAYSGIFRTLCNTHILRTLPYSELCHFQNLGIFRTEGIFRILFIWARSGIFTHIQ